jgi:Flp pilus assembly protein TadG
VSQSGIKSSKTHYLSRRKGQSLVEVCGALIVLIPLLLFLIDGLFVFLGASMNDSICRDAARAAAAGPPSVVDAIATPKGRALTVINHVYYSNLPLKVRDTIDIKENVRDIPPNSQGGFVDGEVTVGTTVDIYPPFVLGAGSAQIVLKSQHTVPFTYVMPAS